MTSLLLTLPLTLRESETINLIDAILHCANSTTQVYLYLNVQYRNDTRRLKMIYRSLMIDRLRNLESKSTAQRRPYTV